MAKYPTPKPAGTMSDRTTKELLAAHQAIIDAWYATWWADQKKRIDEFWARKRC